MRSAMAEMEEAQRDYAAKLNALVEQQTTHEAETNAMMQACPGGHLEDISAHQHRWEKAFNLVDDVSVGFDIFSDCNVFAFAFAGV
jgi:hypothetical protein